ncbi:hypothetical protein HDU96_004167 [Phlyctochytrium bullatum]|nr:hypothetical protein HDU96_004167 [Phlyctochytrium bullatum]
MLAIIAVAIFLPALVSAHGRLVSPNPLSTGFQRLRNNDCGVNVQAAKGQAANFPAGSTQQLTWFVLNGDGAGPLQVKIDPTGTGQNFNVDATVTTNVPGQNGNVGNSGLKQRANVNFAIQVPNVACTGPNGCLMQVRQANNNGFGTCAFVNIAGGQDGGAAAAKGAGAPKGAAKAAAGNAGAAKKNAAKANGAAKKGAAKKGAAKKGAAKKGAAKKGAAKKNAKQAGKNKGNKGKGTGRR